MRALWLPMALMVADCAWAQSSLFLAGDAVQLMRDELMDQLRGLGTGSLRESFSAVVRGGGRRVCWCVWFCLTTGR